MDFTSPPSMRSVEPVIQRAPGDTRKAISFGDLLWFTAAGDARFQAMTDSEMAPQTIGIAQNGLETGGPFPPFHRRSVSALKLEQL
jgi:hypothetical protein